MAIPAKTIVQLTAYPAPALLGSELLEISAGGFSYKINSRMFPLATDSLITVSGMGGSLPGSRQLAAGTGIQLVDNGAGSTLQIFATGVGALPANPTGLIGLTAVNGVAPTWTRSDATHALDQGIVPVWTDQHTFSRVATAANPTVLLSSTTPRFQFTETDGAANNREWVITPISEQLCFLVQNDGGAGNVNWMTVDRTGNTVDSVALTSTAFTWNTSQVLTQANAFANPSASVGLTAVNGAATTAMRSDAAPALSQAIAPTWTAQHIFSLTGATNAAILLSSAQPQVDWNETDGAANNRRWRIEVNGEQQLFRTVNDANSAAVTWMAIDRTLNVVDSIALTSTALTWNGNPLLSTATAFANPSASVGLAAVNGAATTAMRSDAAPALSVAITPTWTGQHTFSNAVTLFSNNAPLIRMTDADGAADAKTWQWDLSVANQLRLTTVTDAIGAGNTVLTFARTGTTIDTITSPTARIISSATYSTLKPQFQISAAIPMFEWLESDAAANNQKWQIAANGEQLLVSVANDADTVSSPAMVIDRTGTTVDSVTFPAKIISTVVASSSTNTYSLSIESSVPFWQLRETDGAANNQRWHFGAQGETFSASVVSDDGLAATSWISVDRTGTTIDTVIFPTLPASGANPTRFVVGTASSTFNAYGFLSRTTVAATGALGAANATASMSTVAVHNEAAAGDNQFLNFGTEAVYTSRGTVDYNRAGGLTRYNTTSDRRLKTNIVDAKPAGDILDAVRVRSFDWKDSDAHLDHWLVAQELYEVFPHAVSKGDDAEELTKEGRTWAVDPTQLVPLMIKELQDLRARVRDLESKPTTH